MGWDRAALTTLKHCGGGGQRAHVVEEGEAGACAENVSRNGGVSLGLGRERGGIPEGLEVCWPWHRSRDLLCVCPLAGSGRNCCPIIQDGWSAAAPGTACPSALWVAAPVTRGTCQQKSAQVTPLPSTRCHGTTGMKQSWQRSCAGPCHAYQAQGTTMVRKVMGLSFH